ncbi:hypothetical protein BDF19DRAFT_466354 [Syncephalis fuscata]|nr:hypothetical protein BDF19DRAFT_466354 [Syncephalis fuscata]
MVDEKAISPTKVDLEAHSSIAPTSLISPVIAAPTDTVNATAVEKEKTSKKKAPKKKKTKKQAVTKENKTKDISTDKEEKVTEDEDIGVAVPATLNKHTKNESNQSNEDDTKPLKKAKNKKPKKSKTSASKKAQNNVDTASTAIENNTVHNTELDVKNRQHAYTSESTINALVTDQDTMARQKRRPDAPNSHRFEPPPMQFKTSRSVKKTQTTKDKPLVAPSSTSEQPLASVTFTTTTPFDLIQSTSKLDKKLEDISIDVNAPTSKSTDKKKKKREKNIKHKKESKGSELATASEVVISYDELSSTAPTREAAVASSRPTKGAVRMAQMALLNSGIARQPKTTTTTTATTTTSAKTKPKATVATQALTPTKEMARESNRRNIYEAHWNQHDVAAGLEQKRLIEGKLRVSQRHRNEAYVTVEGFEDEDVFIYGHVLRNRALDTDTVAIVMLTENELIKTKKLKQDTDRQRRAQQQLTPLTNDKEPALWGKVVAIIYTHKQRLFAGTLSTTRHWWFKPIDKAIPFILIPIENIPDSIQKTFNTAEDTSSLMVTAKIHRWSLTSMGPMGKIIEILGSAGKLDVETKVLLTNAQVRADPFSKRVMACLPSTPWLVPEAELNSRYDMRSFCIFTIDPSTAKDLDDAVSCVRNENGNYSIGVHIADVSHFVLPQTALDEEAQQRGSTTYLVEKAIPMLPSLLCEQLCSLQPGVDRLAFSVIWHMTPDGVILDTWFGKTVIRPCCQLSYEHAQMVIDGGKLPSDLKIDQQPASQIEDDIRLFHTLAQNLRKKRYENGALSIHSVKLSFALDEFGDPIDCHAYERKESHFLIEEFMLLANMSVAKRIAITFPEQALLRRHAPPIARRMESFVELSEQLGYKMDGTSSSTLQNSLASIDSPEVAHVLRCLCVKSMRRAKYFSTGCLDISQYQHYALNAPIYTHFTSPIRRYADIVVHRLLAASLSSGNNSNSNSKAGSGSQQSRLLPSWLRESNPTRSYSISTEEMRELARQCNEGKDRAKKAQDASGLLYLSLYLHREASKLDHGLLRKEAVILEVMDRSVRVLVMEYDIEQRIYLDRLPLDQFIWDESHQRQTLLWKIDTVMTAELVKTAKNRQATKEDTTKDVEMEQEEEQVTANEEDDTVRLITDREDELVDAITPSSPVKATIVTAVTKDSTDESTLSPSERRQVLNVFTKVPVWITVDMDKSPPTICMVLADPFI